MSTRLLLFILAIHSLLLIRLDLLTAPVMDEVAHLAAAASIWEQGRFDLYCVNPPLVRFAAALPRVIAKRPTDWTFIEQEAPDFAERPEWGIGLAFLRSDVAAATVEYPLARVACLPFSLLGAYFCWRWAGDLYGSGAAVVAVILWCTCPNVLAWSATICPDAAAAATGVAAAYCFWCWLKRPTGLSAAVSGIALGAAQLTKMTWLVLFAIWPILWLTWECGVRLRVGRPMRILQLVLIVVLGLFVLNLGYAFDGTFTQLRDFTFNSRALAGSESLPEGGLGGNRFSATWLGHVPVPFPYDYIRGVDTQRVDFERGMPSYLFGEWSDHGWWYYYLACMALKVPTGLLLLGLMAGFCRPPSHKVFSSSSCSQRGPVKTERVWLYDELVLVLPALARRFSEFTIRVQQAFSLCVAGAAVCVYLG